MSERTSTSTVDGKGAEMPATGTTEYVIDAETGETLGRLVDINPFSGMYRYEARGGGHRSIMSEYARIEYR